MAQAQPHEALLGLLAGDGDTAAMLDEGGWRQLARMAADHRLEPLLASMARRAGFGGIVPQTLADRWQAAFRDAAIRALVQRRALQDVTGRLEHAGLPHVALKGAWLAYHAYPHPAERPLRDLDLLLPADALLAAWRLLQSAGWTGPELAPATLAEFAARERHLPPLVSAEGAVVELHGALHDPGDARVDAAALAARMLANAHGDTIRYPQPADLLAHLCIHAAYSHRLNVGPLLLIDIDRLLQVRPADWLAFWRDAEAGGYTRGAALCLALVERWCRPGVLTRSGCPLTIPAVQVDAASALLVQSASARKDIALQGALRHGWRKGGGRGVLALLNDRARHDRRDAAQRVPSLAERLSRMGQAARAALATEIRHAARRTADLDAFLSGA